MEIPFSPSDWVIERNNPSQPGQYTGNWRQAGPHVMVQLFYPGGRASYRPLSCLEKMSRDDGNSIEDCLRKGHFGKVRDLQRLRAFRRHETWNSGKARQGG